MALNKDKTHLWKEDVLKSIDFYNDWFIKFAPKAYRDKRHQTTQIVEDVFSLTNNLLNISPDILKSNPQMLSVLRMSTVPPIAQDRLVGLANTSKNLVQTMEDKNELPPRMKEDDLLKELSKITKTIQQLLDVDILTWIQDKKEPTKIETSRSAAVIADRLCGMMTNPIIRNAQEQRQLSTLKIWLESRGLKHIPTGEGATYDNLEPGTFAFHLNIPVTNPENEKVNVSIDAIIKPKNSTKESLPILVEAKSAGDFTNTNKRRKEEAQKIKQLKDELGDNINYILFLCGYFGPEYLGYEASEGIDWVWEHRIEDLSMLGI